MAKYIDMHCHLGGYENPATAREIGVAAMVYNATVPSDWAAIIARMGNGACGAIGIHPWRVDAAVPGWDGQMLQYLERYPHLMVGEIGLDKNHPAPDAQEQIFARQIEIAARMHRVAHIHCVGAWGRLERILADVSGDMPPLLFHGFSGSVDVMDALLGRYDAYFSFSAFVADGAHRRARACVLHAPKNRIFVESDDYGPQTLGVAVDAVSKIRGCDMSDVLYNNARGLLNHG